MKIAVCQTRTGVNPAENAEALAAMVAEAAFGGAKIVFTPEMSGLLDRNRERAQRSITTEAADVVLKRMRSDAERLNIWIALGSLALAGQREDERLVNRSFVIDDNGVIRARYDKLHLFDVDLPTGERWRESNRYGSGDHAQLVETPVGKIGLSICYDLRFPALYNALSGAGAEILSVPAAFTVPTGVAHWHILSRARAIENAAFVVAAAQSGIHEDGRATYGHSLVVDPFGRVLLDMEEQVGVGFAEINLADVAQVRRQIPVLDHRRFIPQVEQNR
jgi:deaminated glutathione amidase